MSSGRFACLLLGAAGGLALSVEQSASVDSKVLQAKIKSMNSAFEVAHSDYKASQAPAITPSLAPTSDKKFFGKDYPDDLRPTIDSHPKWTYPYPKVQSDAKYDVDYVKDENNDGGHWKAQMDYDEIKMKYIKQQAIVRKAALDEGMEKDEAMKAAKVKDEIWLRKQSADAEAAKAMEEASTASAELDVAVNDEKSAEQKAKEWEEAKKAGKSKAVFEAEQKVERAELHLKDCEKAVQDAKAELASTQAMEAEKQAAAQKAKEEGVQAAKGKHAEKTGTSASKNATLAEKQGKAAAAEKEAQVAKASAEKEEAEDENAKRTLAQEQAKLDRLHTEMTEAEKRLRAFRGEPAQPAGFHAEGHSGTTRLSTWLVMGVVGFTVAMS